MSEQPQNSLCQCGCGQPVTLAPRTHRRFGHIKGQPLRYICGHNRRASNTEKTITIEGPVVLISLGKGYHAKIDVADLETVRRFNWRVSFDSSGRPYARRISHEGGRHSEFLHNFLIPDRGSDQIIDHENGNGLDNRRQNLRKATTQQNNCNRVKTSRKCSSRFKGVCWHSKQSKFIAYIQTNGRKLFLGSFDDEIEAAKAYNQAAQIHHGVFAKLNPIPGAI